MKFATGFKGREQEIVDLFSATFAASEGADEGALIGNLVCALLAETPLPDIRVFIAEQAGMPIACGIFTRLVYPEDPRAVFLLSPMAVATEQQRKGVGQALLKEALQSLQAEGVDIAVTYGDPNYYTRVGFEQISEAQAQAPLPLNLPHGWLGQRLGENAFTPLVGPSRCVAALNRPELW